jgi:hypothetical protein
MADSLVIGDVIELLGGGVPSTHPLCQGAIFRLAPGFDLSAPQPNPGTVASLLLGGGAPIAGHVDNRKPVLPVVIIVPPSGDPIADQGTLAGAREALAQAVSEPRWTMTYTRDGAQPMLLDCFAATAITRAYSIMRDKQLLSEVDVSLEAMPYGRSDTPEVILFAAPSQGWQPPPSVVLLDDFGTNPTNTLSAVNATFEGGIGTWTGAGNSSVAPTSAQFHSGAAAMTMTCSPAGNMQAASVLAANIATGGLPCRAGDTINVSAWFRAAATARSVNAGADFYDNTGTLIGATLRGTSVTDSTTAWTQATAALTAPAGAAWCRANLQVVSAALSEVHYADDVDLDRGNVNPSNWAQWYAASTGMLSPNSARWARQSSSFPDYARTLPAPLDITGRNKISFWAGLGTSTYNLWHTGAVTVQVILTDGSGNTVSIAAHVPMLASALPTNPRWNKVSAPIPQSDGFDFTTISSYEIKLWNKSVKTGQLLQAECYLDTLTASPASNTGTTGARGQLYSLPGAVGTAIAPLQVQLQPGPLALPVQAVFTTAGSNNWTAPAGVTSVQMAECWAGGGGGCYAGTATAGAGAGGGEYAADYNIPVTPATVYHPVVGAGGTGGLVSGPTAATNGGSSSFTGDSGRSVLAHGGAAGGTRGQIYWQGYGGTGSGNALHFDGGDGQYTGGGTSGGGGGGSGGTNQNGNDCNNTLGSALWPGAPAVVGGSRGGDGGRTNATPHSAPADPYVPGSGGGGGALDASNNRYNGAGGTRGQVRLTWGATSTPPLKTAVIHLPPRMITAIAPLVVTGNGVDVPNGATNYTCPATGSVPARYHGTYQVILCVGTWNTPANARTLTVTIYQRIAGGASQSVALTKTLTPNTDPDPLRPLTGLVTMGTVNLPLSAIAPGNSTDYFQITVNDTNTSDRVLDTLILDTTGQTMIYSTAGAGLANLWATEPDIGMDYGMVYGSATADWSGAVSVLPDTPVLSGGPLAVMPGENPFLVYSVQGLPAAQASYLPRWILDRLA